jgi:hypothetical protein
VREMIRKYVKPYYDSFDERSREVMGNSVLCFAFAHQQLPKTPPLDALPMPLELTQSVDVLCAWLLQELSIDTAGFSPDQCEFSNDLGLVHRQRRTVRPGR